MPFSSGDVFTAAELNTITGAWTADARSASSIWQTAGTAPAIGNGTLTSRYQIATTTSGSATGKTLKWTVVITAGSTTTFGTGSWLLIPPATLKLSNGIVFDGLAFDSSAGNRYPVSLEITSTTQMTCRVVQSAGSGSPATYVNFGPSSPFAWATSDTLGFTISDCELA